MIIKKISINAFGKLKDIEIEPKEGLNVIYGSNGSGKSTLMNFMKSVFYGVGKSKERGPILPWDGTLPSGSVTYEHEGRSFICQMKLGKTARGDKISVFDSISGEEVSGEPIGKALFKMSESTFRKTAFISSEGSEISPKGEDEIAEKLANLSQSGDESVSYNKAFSAVDDYMARLIAKRGRGGRITQLEDSIEELKSEYTEAISKMQSSADLRDSLKSSKQSYDALLKEIKELKCAEDGAVYIKAKSFKDELETAGEETDISGIDELCDSINTLQIKLSSLREKQSSIPEVSKDNEISDGEFENITELFYTKPSGKKGIFILSLILSACFLALGIKEPRLFLGVPVFLVTAYLLRPKNVNLPLEQKLSELGFSDYESFKAHFMEQKSLKTAFEKNTVQLNNEISHVTKELENARKTAKDRFGTCEISDLRAIRQREDRRKTLKESLNALLSGKNFDELKEKYKNSPSVAFDAEILADKEAQAEALRNRIFSLERSLGSADGGFTPPDEIKRRIDELSEKCGNLSYIYSVLSEIRSTLSESYEIMEGEFGEKLNTSASDILKGITDSNMSPRINKSFQMKLSEEGSIHDAKDFSTGLFQQASLSFRLAMMGLMDSPSPLFLDDCAMAYDDQRAENLIKYLSQYGKSRQIFMFTCRERDAVLSEKYGGKCFNMED